MALPAISRRRGLLMASLTVITSGAEMVKALHALSEWADTIDFAFAWASSSEGHGAHWAAIELAKVRHAVVGVHFNQTEPAALMALHELKVLRVVAETSGVFHPKVVLGRKGDQGRVILGSSNFTGGGYGANIELNAQIDGELTAPSIAAVVNFIDAQWASPRSFVPDAAWLIEYAAAYAARPKPPRTPPPPGASQVKNAADLDVDFDRYFGLVTSWERRTLASGDPVRVFDHEAGSYLEEAEACQAALKAFPSFGKMPVNLRKHVAGWGEDTSGYFGRMTGAGYFKNVVLKHPDVLAEHLDKLPLTGKVSRVLAEDVLTGLVGVQGVALGVASRLLAVKRPDLYMPVNNANRERIAAIFGSAPATVGGYLTFHEKLWKYPWATASAPAGEPEKRVWAARVALLDALVYEIPPYQRPS